MRKSGQEAIVTYFNIGTILGTNDNTELHGQFSTL